MNMQIPRLVLASGSVYRRELLSRLRVPFEVRSPDIDESPHPMETPVQTSQRLARLKAEAVAQHEEWQHADAVIIGADQVAQLNALAMGKPGTHERAFVQLQQMRGQTIYFHSSVTVIRPATGYVGHATNTSRVRMRELTDDDINRYLLLEQPFDCAGSAKAESLGICLLDRIESDDPTSLIGLPLIDTTRLLREAGIDPLHC